MSEKEQAQALKLLAAWMEASRLGNIPRMRQLEKETQGFLRLSVPTPESHGQRRG